MDDPNWDPDTRHVARLTMATRSRKNPLHPISNRCSGDGRGASHSNSEITGGNIVETTGSDAVAHNVRLPDAAWGNRRLNANPQTISARTRTLSACAVSLRKSYIGAKTRENKRCQSAKGSNISLRFKYFNNSPIPVQFDSHLVDKSDSKRHLVTYGRLEQEDGRLIEQNPARTYLGKRGVVCIPSIALRMDHTCRAVTENDKKQARRRFTHLVCRVLTLVRCMRVIIHNSRSITVQTAVELQWHTLHNSKQAKKLAFNPAHYAKSKAHAKLPKWAKLILKKEAGDRSEPDCRRLHALLRGLKSFDKFTERIQIAMCRAFTYQNVDAQRVILRKGHIGQFFYFLYSGTVFVNVEDINANGEKFIKTEVVLGKGDSFGELSLLQDIRRTASISCREMCEVLVVDKDVFSLVCPKIFEKELDEKVNFLSHLPLFHAKYWSSKDLNNLCFEAQIQEYKTNKVVVKCSREDEWMYICMEGQCRIIKCLVISGEGGFNESDHVTLLPEEDMITAEFLDSMHHAQAQSRSATRHSRSTRSRRSGSELLTRTKNLMLKSLAIKYTNSQEKDLLAGADDDEDATDFRARAQPGIITLSMLMAQKNADSKQGLIYLDIATVQPNQVFDLTEALQPSSSDKDSGSSDLILVSSGARLLRIKKSSFRASLSSDARDHAKHIAMKELYPTSPVLLKSYKVKVKWDQYKAGVVDDVVHSEKSKNQRRSVGNRPLPRRPTPGRQADHVLTTLRKASLVVNTSTRDSDPQQLALDESLVVDHLDFESRLLRETDAQKLREVACQSGSVRRGSVVKSRTITSQSAVETKDTMNVS